MAVNVRTGPWLEQSKLIGDTMVDVDNMEYYAAMQYERFLEENSEKSEWYSSIPKHLRFLEENSENSEWSVFDENNNNTLLNYGEGDGNWNNWRDNREEEIGANATNPAHYNSIPEHLQHWNVVAEMGWCYHMGCATKYLWRAGKKSSAHQSDLDKQIEDLEKSVVYINKKIELLKQGF